MWNACGDSSRALAKTAGILCALLLRFGGDGVASSFAAAEAKPPRPNILWLIAEDFGPQLGCYGAKEVRTPGLDQFARQGTRYSRFYTTAPVCSPSRSALMTGMYQTTIGAHQHRTRDKRPLGEGVRLLTDWLRDGGYFTANVVELPPGCGFKGTGKTDWNFQREGKPFDSRAWADLKAHQPFFAQVNFSETHRAFRAPAQADPAKVELPPYYPDHPIARKDYAAYLDAAMELDRKVGRVLAQLKADRLERSTIVVFFGDNGQAHVRGKQFCYEEGLHVPLVIRWPAGLAAPAQLKPGAVDERLLCAIDLAPTMLSLAGLPKPARMEGQVFLGAQAEPPREHVFGARDRCDMTVMRLRTVRDHRYRYIRNFTPHVPFLAFNEYKERSYPVWNLLKQLHAEGKLTPPQAALCAPAMAEEELYDLQADPHEIHNLARSDRPEHVAALERLRGVLKRWIAQTGDQGRRLETLEELKQAEPRFVPERDWRPAPGAQGR